MTKNLMLLVASIAVFLILIEAFLRTQDGVFIKLDGFSNKISDYSSQFHHT